MGIVNNTNHKPKPFQRPGISLEGAHGKSWQQLTAGDVRIGDIVKGHNRGLVTDVVGFSPTVSVTFKNGITVIYMERDPVEAFAETRS